MSSSVNIYILTSKKEAYSNDVSFFKSADTKLPLSLLDKFLSTGEINYSFAHNFANSAHWFDALTILQKNKEVLSKDFKEKKELLNSEELKEKYLKYLNKPIPLNEVSDISEIAHLKKLLERIGEDKSIIKYIL